ncbi:TetR/AcrR family transcriptional regulator [Paraliobacillus sediminis]|uniref:TetR/AcrR family transcriptional regulator n=1 Tax=Paraliobacillus sediminis TaxID=1885916 RepID=UPI000E3E0EE6|nr:TetR/AcrR family transcriptional regulator [Paraliobacillus sediminis]
MVSRTKLDRTIILEKATEFIDLHGLDQLSLNLLAQELHIKPPSLYNHFDGLQGVKQELAIYGTEQLYVNMLPAAIGRTGDEAVRALSRAYIDFAKIHPGLYDATNRIPDSTDKKLQDAQNAILNLVVQVLQDYQLEEDMIVHIVRGLRSILHGFSSLDRTGGFQMSVNLESSFSILIDTFIEGIHSMVQKQGRSD